MTASNEPKVLFSLIVPLSPDTERFDGHIANVCSVLDDHIPNCYEIVAIDGKGKDVPENEWEAVKGEVLVIIDGNLDQKPATLSDVINAFNDGSDMAFAEQYREGQKKDRPELSYFGVRRSSLPRLHHSPKGYQLIVEILGSETIDKLSNDPSAISGNYILKNLKKVIGVQPTEETKTTKTA